MDAEADERTLHPSNVAIIREVYDSEYCFSAELEKALDACCAVIVIEPNQLGDETARWIKVGNYFHITAVVTGLGSIAAGFALPRTLSPQVSLGLISGLFTSLYTVAWQFDHCVKYQVERDPRKLARLPAVSALSGTAPVVLVRKDNTTKILTHCTISLAALAFCTYRLFRAFK